MTDSALYLIINGSGEFMGDVVADQSYDAFIRTAKTQQIDAPLPNNLMVDDGKFLMDA